MTRRIHSSIVDVAAQNRVRELVLEAYTEYEERSEAAASDNDSGFTRECMLKVSL